MPSRPGRMRKFRIDETSFVDKAAQDSGMTPFMKRAVVPNADESLIDFVKRYPREGSVENQIVEAMLVHEESAFGKFADSVPVMTSEEEGHAHILWLHGSRGGETTMQISTGDEHFHDHVWTIGADGILNIASAQGHGHTVDQSAVLAAMQEMFLQEIDAPDAVVDVVFANSAGEDITKGLSPDIATLVIALQSGSIIAKYTDGEPVAFRASLPDGTFPIRCHADLATAISLIGTDEDQNQAAQHIVKRARVLGLESELPTDGLLAEIAKTGHPAGGNLSTGNQMPNAPKGSDGDGLQKKLDDVTAANEILTKKVDTFTKVAGLSEPHRSHYASLGEEKQATFLAKSEGDRTAELDELTKGDPVIYTADDDTVYRKSGGLNIAKMAERIDNQAKELALSKAITQNAVFEKRASEELPNLPGDTKVRAGMLKAFEAIDDEEIRKGAFEALKAGNDALAKRFVRSGGSKVAPNLDQGDAAAAEEELTAKAKDLVEKSAASDNPLDFYDAFDKVSENNPELAVRAVGNAVKVEG